MASEARNRLDRGTQLCVRVICHPFGFLSFGHDTQRWIWGGYIKASEGLERNIMGDGCKSEKPGDVRKSIKDSIKWERSTGCGGEGGELGELRSTQ